MKVVCICDAGVPEMLMQYMKKLFPMEPRMAEKRAIFALLASGNSSASEKKNSMSASSTARLPRAAVIQSMILHSPDLSTRTLPV